MKDVMLDLETMGTTPDAAIIAIGAVEFDPELGQLGERFYQVVDLQSSVDLGGVIEPSTVMWWMQQSEEARAAVRAGGAHLAVALGCFTTWLEQRAARDEVRIWGNGANFDNVVLATAYARAGHLLPWRFFNDRCYRTMKAQRRDVKLERSGTHHNALDDAVSQAQHLLAIMATPAPQPEARAA
jgi:exodeoxyribonuclease VIII